MAIDLTLVVKKIQKLDGFITLFSPLTRMPYVECDPETFDDQIHIFASEESSKEFAKTLLEKTIPVTPLKIAQPQMNGFFSSLYALDVNAVIFHDDAGITRLETENLVKRPDMEKLMNEKIPIMNPPLTLTTIYFLQELRRPVKHDMAQLHELEDEMIANLMKARLIMGIETVNDEENTDPEKVNMKNVRIPFVKTKEGDIYQTIYSDFSEFRKYTGPNAPNQRMSTLTFQQLPHFLIKDSKGFVLNPAGVNLVLTGEQIRKVLESFQPE